MVSIYSQFINVELRFEEKIFRVKYPKRCAFKAFNIAFETIYLFSFSHLHFHVFPQTEFIAQCIPTPDKMHIPVLLWKERTIPVEVHIVGVEYAQVGRVLGVPAVSQRQKLKHNQIIKV